MAYKFKRRNSSATLDKVQDRFKPVSVDAILGNPQTDQLFELTDEEILLIVALRKFKESIDKSGVQFKWMTGPYNPDRDDLHRLTPLGLHIFDARNLRKSDFLVQVKDAPDNAPIYLDLTAAGKGQMPLRYVSVGALPSPAPLAGKVPEDSVLITLHGGDNPL